MKPPKCLRFQKLLASISRAATGYKFEALEARTPQRKSEKEPSQL